MPGAINIPLGELTPERATQLDRSRPIVTYCYDTQCDMSPRAAWRLESLGFGEVYDYAYRPDITAVEMAQRMRDSDLQTAPVTSSDGRFVGLVLRNDVEPAAEPPSSTTTQQENPAARQG